MKKTLTKLDRRDAQPNSPKRQFGLFSRIALVVALATCVGSTCALATEQARLGAEVTDNSSVPFEAKGVTVDQKLGDSIRLDLPLKDSNGREIKTGYVIDGNLPTIITMNYSDCPMLCSIQLNKLTDALDELDLKVGEDFKILTVSIDPKETTRRAAETKKKYLGYLKNQPGAKQGWVFATAKQPIIANLADALGFRYKYDSRIKQYNHPAMLAFVSPTGVITRYSLDIEFPPDQLKMALVEAGEGNVGTPVDQFILWCYSYDPQSNSYTPAAWKIMRICGAGFVLIMLACLVPFWVGRKKPKTQDAVFEDSGFDDSSPDAVAT